MNYNQARQYLPFAKAVYGGGDEARTPIAVGNITPVAVTGFTLTPNSGFGGALYKDPATGKYTIAFVGSEVQDFAADWVKTDGVLATQDLFKSARDFVGSWNPQMSDALNFGYAAVKQITNDLKAEGNQNPTMDDVRARLDVTGHSLGGALAEMVGKFFGLKGANIDGPGVRVLIGESQYTAMQDKVANDPDIVGFQRDYVRNGTDFVSSGFSFVSIAGTHLADTNFQAQPSAAESYYSVLGLLGGGGLAANPALIGAGLATLVKDGLNHPLGAILG